MTTTVVLGFGAVGRATAQALLARGDRVRVAQRSRPGDLPTGAEFCACDVFDAQSVAAAANKINTPQNSKRIGNPQRSTLGLRVSSTTISSGTKKIRRMVKEFGRFIAAQDLARTYFVTAWPLAHYRLRHSTRQRAMGNEFIRSNLCGTRENRAI